MGVGGAAAAPEASPLLRAERGEAGPDAEASPSSSAGEARTRGRSSDAAGWFSRRWSGAATAVVATCAVVAVVAPTAAGAGGVLPGVPGMARARAPPRRQHPPIDTT